MFSPSNIVEKIVLLIKGLTGKIDTSIKGINPPKTCKITGKDISDQKKGSKFISARKVGYKTAHRVRNRDSNPRNRLRYKLKKLKKQPTLFPLDEMVVLTREQKEQLKFWEGSEYEVKL